MLTFQVTTWVNIQPATIRPVKLYSMLRLWGRRPPCHIRCRRWGLEVFDVSQ